MKSDATPKQEKKDLTKSSSRKTMISLLIMGLLYFVVLIFPNLTGAKDANMLGVFNNDEFAQYPFVLNMITPGATLFQSIHNFAVYSYYYYGYPFFFFSALFLIPLKLILGASWMQHTQGIMAYLRQMINILPMLIAIGFMVFTQTRFRSFWRTHLLVVLILLLPAVTYNSLWWHPDSVFTLFAVLTLFFFWCDNHRLGINFILAAFFCGLTIGTKQSGVLFVLTAPVYILWSGIRNDLPFLNIIWKILSFLLIMVGAVIVSNPLLLLPIERGEIIVRILQGFGQNVLGFYTTSTSLIKWISSASIVTDYNGCWLFLAVLLALQVIGVLDSKKRLLSILILTWFVPYVLFFTFVETTMKPYYFLPVIVPLVSGVDILLERVSILCKQTWSFRPWRKFAEIILVVFASVLIIGQAVLFTVIDVNLYGSTLTREQNSASLRFYEGFQKEVLAKLPQDLPLKFYHDWKAYIPDGQPHWQVITTFDLANYDYIQSIQPDFILLERENMLYFSNSALLTNSVNSEKAIQRLKFYSDSLNGSVQGYALVYQDSFGSVFAKQDLQEKYLSKNWLEIPQIMLSGNITVIWNDLLQIIEGS